MAGKKKRRRGSKKRMLSKKKANTLLRKLSRGGADAISDRDLGKLIIRTDARTKRRTLRLLRIDD